MRSSIGPAAIVSGHDVKDECHISLFSGCTGELWSWGVIGFCWIYPEQSEYSDSEIDGEEPGHDGLDKQNRANPSGGVGNSAAATEEEREGPQDLGAARAGPAKRQQRRFERRSTRILRFVGWWLGPAMFLACQAEYGL